MTDEEIKKKERRPKPSSDHGGKKAPKTFPTLAHIVLSNGSQVDIPKLPSNTSELTSYDHLRIAMEYAALATCCLRELGLHPEMKMTLSRSLSLDNVLMNLQDLMNHLYYAIQGFPENRGSS